MPYAAFEDTSNSSSPYSKEKRNVVKGSRRCACCGIPKPFSMFGRYHSSRARTPDGKYWNSYCKVCRRVKNGLAYQPKERSCMSPEDRKAKMKEWRLRYEQSEDGKARRKAWRASKIGRLVRSRGKLRAKAKATAGTQLGLRYEMRAERLTVVIERLRKEEKAKLNRNGGLR